MRHDLEESTADPGGNPSSELRQLRRAWVQGVLFYILVIVPVVAGFNDRGPLARLIGTPGDPHVIAITARTKTPAPVSSLEFEPPNHSVAFRLVELFVLLSIPVQLVFITLRWLFWNQTSRGQKDFRSSG